jgi:hypothetical protein
MRKYADLTEAEKKQAFERGFQKTMKGIEACPSWFPDIEKEIEKANNTAESNRTPWFFQEILYHEIPGAKEKINQIIQEHIEGALYPESGEYVIYL